MVLANFKPQPREKVKASYRVCEDYVAYTGITETE